MSRLGIHVVRPVLIWAVHFIAVYALISAACAPRMLLEPDIARASAAILTGLLAVLLIVWLMRAGRIRTRLADDTAQAPLAQAAWWSVQISLLAILANLWPLAVMTTCSG